MGYKLVAMRNLLLVAASAVFDNELQSIVGLEPHDWKGLLHKKPSPYSHPYDTSFTYWGQGVAAGHLKAASEQVHPAP